MEKTEEVDQAFWESKEYSQYKRQRRRKGNTDCNCKSPFHFLKKIVDLSKQRLTRCLCSRIEKSKSALPDIRSHFSADPSKSVSHQPSRHRFIVDKSVTSLCSHSLDHKHVPKSQSYNSGTLTRTDLIRSEHDRGKKRKMTQLNLFQMLPVNFKKKYLSLR